MEVFTSLRSFSSRVSSLGPPTEVAENCFENITEGTWPCCIEKQKFGKRTDEIYLVNTARLVTQKANDDIIRAMTMLPKNISFLLVGSGPEKNKLEQLTKKLNLQDRIRNSNYRPEKLRTSCHLQNTMTLMTPIRYKKPVLTSKLSDLVNPLTVRSGDFF